MNLDGSKMSKRDRDKKLRERVQLWLKNKKGSVSDIAAGASLDQTKLDEWIADSKKQLDLPVQAAIMHVIGMSDAELPEILVHDFRKNGYLPNALLNFLALLGWNPGGDKELMSVDEMKQLFGIEGIGKSNAKFNREKLLAFNTEAGASTPIDRLVKAMREYLAVNPDSPLNRASDEQLATVIRMKTGFRTLRQIDEASRFLFEPDDQVKYEPDAVEKVLKKNDAQGLNVLRDVREILANVSDWAAVTLEKAIQEYGEQKQLALGKVAQPLRVALRGGTISPPIFQTIEFLGKPSTLARVERCLLTIGEDGPH
jgi:glutamyl-tRNA synthetase